MGRISDWRSRERRNVKQMREQLTLFGFEPEKADVILLKPLRHRIWTENKARLVQRYINYFLYITRHGTYIDGFAGAQYPDLQNAWAAKLVVELQPRWLRNIYMCEIDKAKADALQSMVDSQEPRNKEKKEPARQTNVLFGDFNNLVDEILADGNITEKEATFCLLDQHTFECKWTTVLKLASHKKSGPKIELFYFLPVKWLHRALSGLSDSASLQEWWGNSDWEKLKNSSTNSIREAMTERFTKELNYGWSHSWPIFERAEGGAVMYYMIHATDHRQAPLLMRRAYEKALTAPEPQEQFKMDFESGNFLGNEES